MEAAVEAAVEAAAETVHKVDPPDVEASTEEAAEPAPQQA